MVQSHKTASHFRSQLLILGSQVTHTSVWLGYKLGIPMTTPRPAVSIICYNSSQKPYLWLPVNYRDYYKGYKWKAREWGEQRVRTPWSLGCRTLSAHGCINQAKAVPVGFLWRFYYVGVVDKIEHWWFSQSPAPPALINFSRKGMYGQDIRRQNGKTGNLHLEYGLEQGALGSQNQWWLPTIPAWLAFPDAHWFWGLGCELLSLGLGHLGPCRILFLLLLLPYHSTWVAEFKSTFCCLRGSGSKWVDLGAWLHGKNSFHRTSPSRRALEKSEEKSPNLPPLGLYYCI